MTKMVLCSVCAFYSTQRLIVLMLVIFTAILVLYAWLDWAIRPCIAVSWNLIDVYAYFIISWVILTNSHTPF